jgi:hypothetical protein
MGALNNIYDHARLLLLTGDLDWRVTDIVVTAWPGAAVFVPTDVTIADIKARGYAERGSSLPITGMAASVDGTAETDAVVLPAVPIGPDITWFTLSRRNATPDFSELILYLDDMEGQLPFTANGLDVVLQPDWLEARGWFRP